MDFDFNKMFAPFLHFGITLILIALLLFVTFVLILYCWYKKSIYAKQTRNSFFKMMLNSGAMGEYNLSRKLKKYQKDGAVFLFNTYIPKNQDETTEIDVVMICRHGVFVFENKNYSGWIYGKENQKNWCQVLPAGKGKSHKEFFYNPVKQNKTHIKHLKTIIGQDVPIYSVVTFSNRCTLKDISVNNDIPVIQLNDVHKTISSIIKKNNTHIVEDAKIDELYNLLSAYTNVSEDVKRKHIENVKTTRQI